MNFLGQANPLVASQRLAWLVTLGFHLALGGLFLGIMAITPARMPVEPSPSLLVRLTPTASSPPVARPVTAPALPEPVPALASVPPQPPTKPPAARPRAQAPPRVRPTPTPAPASLTEAPAAPNAQTPAPTTIPVQEASQRAAAEATVQEEARRLVMLEVLADLLEREKHYPLSARRGGISGRVMLQIEFDQGGRPQAWRVLGDDAPEVLSQAALEAMTRVAQRLEGNMGPLAGRQVRVPLHYILE